MGRSLELKVGFAYQLKYVDVLRAKNPLISRGFQPKFWLSGYPGGRVSALKPCLQFHSIRWTGERRTSQEIPPEIPFLLFRVEHLSDRLEVIRLINIRVPNLPHEELLVVLCAHTAKHVCPRSGLDL